MCVTATGRIVGIDRGRALVEIDGRRLQASLLLGPDIDVGDDVLVAAGRVIRRLNGQEAIEIAEILEAAQSLERRLSPVGTNPAGGSPR